LEKEPMSNITIIVVLYTFVDISDIIDHDYY